MPNGIYVLGWVWYGGVVDENVDTNQLTEPDEEGSSIDYWSCAFVRIKGGKSLVKQEEKQFVNDMSKFSEKGCRAINNRPGICTRDGQECENVGVYRKPKEFLNGKKPKIYQRYYR